MILGTEDRKQDDSLAAAHRLALDRLNSEPPLPERLIHPHEVASIEGAAEGVRAAAEAGLRTVGIGEGAASGGADHAAGGLEELDLATLDSG